MSYLYGDYGMNPRRAPMFLHALVATHYKVSVRVRVGVRVRVMVLHALVATHYKVERQ